MSPADVNECAVLNGECAHNCTDLAVGHACWCRAGWRRAGASACRDVDECAEDEPCDQRCRCRVSFACESLPPPSLSFDIKSSFSPCSNTIGSFVCSCNEGYKLMSDGISCEPISCKWSRQLINKIYLKI